jgi:hypothetical protein
MDGKTLRHLSLVRIEEAKTLLTAKQYSGSYYLAGYSVECAVKACVAKTIRRSQIQPKGFERDFFQHDLNKLAKLAQLISNDKLIPGTLFSGDIDSLEVNWAVVKDWSEQSRYSIWSKQKADAIVEAVGNESEGILAWLRLHW